MPPEHCRVADRVAFGHFGAERNGCLRADIADAVAAGKGERVGRLAAVVGHGPIAVVAPVLVKGIIGIFFTELIGIGDIQVADALVRYRKNGALFVKRYAPERSLCGVDTALGEGDGDTFEAFLAVDFARGAQGERAGLFGGKHTIVSVCLHRGNGIGGNAPIEKLGGIGRRDI